MNNLSLVPLGSLTDTNGKPLVDIQHSPERGLVYVQWFGNLTSREVVQVARSYLDIQTKLHNPLLLNDKRLATGDWSEAMEWLEYEWLPACIHAGLRTIAYVFSPDMHNQLASLDFYERVQQHLHLKLFYDMPAALQWLQQRSQSSASGFEAMDTST
ncbi:hypothetical protein CDA63_10305 [Hymenobacter amundsenii]|uniref:STAS/SEC14 domain-containing protein n=1 Tax=Hymenobacter amundsenii TaxID=2006685 RepID=A0A2D0AFU6_9BACT|nr:hypothetical protein [Hymenobacter amundsenii]OWP63237.1 hypothetical protein CDA63_10305 [Hymenobacter amundsenii]